MSVGVSQLHDNAASYDKNISLDYLRTVMNPREYNVMPDSTVENANSVSNSVDYSLTFDVNDPLPTPLGVPAPSGPDAQPEECPSKEGLILHLTKYGPFALFHMGFVKATRATPKIVNIPTVSFAQPAHNIRGLTLYNHYYGAVMGATGAALPFWQNDCQFAWTGPVALPRSGANNGINAGPDIGKNFSKVRTYAGIVQLEGNAVAVGASSLTGAISTAVISDTRDLSYVLQNGNTQESYPVASMSQQSVTRGEVLKSVKLEQGATMLIGPDYSRDFASPDRLATIRAHGEMRTITQTIQMAAGGMIFNRTLNGGEFFTVHPSAPYSLFVTPWSTDFVVAYGSSTALASTQANHNNINVGPIDEMGTLDVEVTIPWMPWVGNGSDNNAFDVQVKLVVNFIHFFCNINDNGTINYNTFSETQSEVKSSTEMRYTSSFGQTAVTGQSHIQTGTAFKSSAGKFRTSFTDKSGGKYCGTYVQPSFTVIGDAYLIGAVPFACATNQPIIRVAATTIDESGAVGPAHIVRYDGVTKDQQLIVRGMSLVEGIANGILAPYVQNKGAKQLSVFNPRVQTLLQELFETSPYFKRCMTTKYYTEVVLPFVDKMQSGHLLEEAEDKPSLAVAASASGLFGAIGAGLGGVADHLFGGASGQFGAAGGQFGDAAGQFGGSEGSVWGSSAGRRNRSY